MSAGPTLSVVIRTYNEAKYLPALLDALAAQTRDHEVIIVDSGSTDATLSIAARADRLVSIESHDFTFGYSLNAGIREARGAYVVLASAHTLPLASNWLERMVAPLAGGAAMVYGRQLGRPGVSKFSEIQDLRRTFGEQREVMRPPRFFANNANAAIRRELWEEHEFDETLPGLEDIEWARHWMLKGSEVIYEPEAAVFHIHDESWQQVQHRYYREAVARRRLGLEGPMAILPEALREARSVVTDAVRLAGFREEGTGRRLPFWRTLSEVIAFRAWKLAGTARGLLDSRALSTVEQRRQYYFDDEYRAVAVTGKGHAKLVHRAMPAVKPGDVLVRVAYVGICGTDLEIFHGTLGYYAKGIARYPIVPGHEVSGVVVSAGARVQELRPGDPVVVECIQSCGACDFCRQGNPIACPQRAELGVIGLDGGYGEYLLASDRFVHRVPAGLDLRRAALCEPLAVALKGLDRLARAWPRTPEVKRCAVVGAGPLGHLCALVLENRGHRVTVFDRNPERRRLLPDRVATASDLRELDTFDAVVEVTGDPDAAALIVRYSRPGATILLLGLPYAHREFSFEDIVAYDKILVGSVGSGPADFRAALAILPKLELEPFLRHAVPLESYEAAWQASRQGRYLKTMLAVAPPETAQRSAERLAMAGRDVATPS